MLADPGYTPYDLRFRLGSIPVRIHPFFWLVSALLGWPAMNERGGGFQFVLAWVACVFVSILIHEMGHVLMGMQFGARGEIVLYSFGGLAIGSSNLGQRWQRIAVMLAGPGAQFVFLGVIWLVERSLGEPSSRLQSKVFEQLGDINLYWPILNLFPIWPLDGGQVSRELFVAAKDRDGIRYSLILSIVCAIGIAVYVFSEYRSIYMVLMFGLLAFGSYQLLQQYSGPRGGGDDGGRGGGGFLRRESYDDRAPWEQDPDYWKK